jgi:hypothetical protein
MPYSYNPLIAAKLDKNKKDLNDLDNVNTSGTVDGYVLTYGTTLDTWTPEAGGAGDMLKADYVTGLGTVYNASRLSGDVLATVQAHNVAASKITSGTLGLARIPAVDDARIPDLDTLSYSGAFAAGQIPNLPTSKITSGSFNANRIPSLAASKITSGTFNANRIPALPTSRITTGTFNLNRIPAVDDARIPDLDTLSYGGAFATAQIPAVGAYKTTTGTFTLARIPAMDAAHIPNLPATKITTGTFNADRIPSLPTARITTGTFNLNRIPSVDDARIPNLETLSYGGAFAVGQIPSLAASKITSGTLSVARQETLDNLNGTVALNQIPTMDDGHIPDLDTLSYSGAFAAGQIPNLPTSKITSGTFTLARIPAMDDARIQDNDRDI